MKVGNKHDNDDYDNDDNDDNVDDDMPTINVVSTNLSWLAERFSARHKRSLDF